MKIVISHHHRESAYAALLITHMATLRRSGVIVETAGVADRPSQIRKRIRQADIFIALVSPDYISEARTFEIEAEEAMRQRERGLRLIPLVVRECDWKSTLIGGLQPALPMPLVHYRDIDEAMVSVMKSVRGVIYSLILERNRGSITGTI